MNCVLTTREALLLCKNEGKPITKTGLKQNGIRFGFIFKSQDGFHWSYDKNGLLKFLNRLVPVPIGYVPISYLAKKYDVSVSNVYYWLKIWNVPTIECGRYRWKYVHEENFEKIKWENRRIPLYE